jgi:hypothetical protein
LLRAHPEPLGRKIEEDRAHLGAGQAQRRAAVLHRLAACSLALVRCLGRIAGDQPDAGERQVELLGRDLLERGEDALAELDLAGEDGSGAIGVDADPAVEPAIVLQASRQAFLPPGELGIEGEGDDERTEAGRELAPVESESVHVRSSRWSGQRAAPHE